MAIRTLIAKTSLRKINALLPELRSTHEELTQREAELSGKLESDGLTEEELKEVEADIAKLEEEWKRCGASAGEEVRAIDESIDIGKDGSLADAITGLEKRAEELKTIISESDSKAKRALSAGANTNAGTIPQERNEKIMVSTEEIRSGFFKGYKRSSIEAMLSAEDTQKFLTAIRAKEGTVSGVDLSVPVNMVELLMDNLHKYSKLYKHVKVRKLKGKDRQNIMGDIPEGIWMESTGTLNELKLSISQIEIDGYKVGGFCIIPNSYLEDSDINLAAVILEALAQSIGLALDKAILYGTGVKMPKGIVTRLALTEQPAWWGSKQAAFTDLSTKNIMSFTSSEAAMTDAKFFAVLVERAGVIKSNYGGDSKFWCMNTKTYNRILSKAVSVTSAGAITAQINGTLPIVGGAIEILDFIPDGDMIGGYGTLYNLAERSEVKLGSSDQVKYIEDQTVYKGTARYDGMPVFGEAFVAINIFGNPVKTTMTFAPDTANEDETSDGST